MMIHPLPREKVWTFEDELKFVSSLGRWSGVLKNGFTRRKLLQNYVIGVERRTDGLFNERQLVALRERAAVELMQEAA